MNQEQNSNAAQDQNVHDEALVFELAGCMMDLYTAMLTRDPKGTTAVVMRVGQLLKRDSTFVARFRSARIAVAAEQDRQARMRALQP